MTDTDKLTEILDASADYWQTSCAIVVLQNREPVLRCCYGFADKEKGLPFTENTRISLPCSGGFASLCRLILGKHDFKIQGETVDMPVAAIVREQAEMSVAEFLAAFVFAKLGIYAKTTMPSDARYQRYVLNKESGILPPETGEGCFTVSACEMEAFAKALVWGRLLPAKVRERAERDKSFCGRIDSLHVFSCGDWLRICYSRELDVCFVYLRNETTREEKKNGNWLSFYKDLRREVTAAYMTPQSTRVVPYGRGNALTTMNILLHDDQLPFVADARTCICFAYANRRTDRIFVLMDRTQAVGLVQLHIDRKRNQYEIGILQIDKRFQGRGYGRAFLNWCIEYLREKGAGDILLHCHERNLAGLRLYRSAGFKETGTRDECIVLTLRTDR
jgi:diamine N-acetyltransferase